MDTPSHACPLSPSQQLRPTSCLTSSQRRPPWTPTRSAPQRLGAPHLLASTLNTSGSLPGTRLPPRCLPGPTAATCGFSKTRTPSPIPVAPTPQPRSDLISAPHPDLLTVPILALGAVHVLFLPAALLSSLWQTRLQ